ncbi:MAG TPA: nuclear transport factor 2 family protein [Stellaceae bacterium]|nr:nuclear transport factor 2 family protein [Stellaceae bacterium]
MTSTDDSKTIAADLLRLEDERSRAVMAGDVAVLERLMSDHIVYTHSSGRQDTKRSFIASVTGGAVKYRRIHRRDAAVAVRDGFAFLTGAIEIDVETSGQLRHLVLRYSNVWERTPQGWQQVLWQTTPIPPQ